MHHLPFFSRSKRTGSMDAKTRRRPRLERRNADKHIDYDASSCSSSLDDSSSCSLVTRSLDLADRTSFRIEGTDGEFDRICQSLGLSGPDDFSIPAAAWEAMKVRSSSDILPRSRFNGADSPKVEEVEQHVKLRDRSILCGKALDGVRISDSTELTRCEPSESAERVVHFGIPCSAAGGGIKGARPPLLKPPPSMRLPVMDNTCSTWDILRDFAPQNDRGSLVMDVGNLSSDDDDEEERGRHNAEVVNKREEEEDLFRIGETKREEEENLLRIGETAHLSESCSFTTSNDDDSSSTTTEPMSNISPNSRFKSIIDHWEKGELLGRGSFGSVYEGISE